MRRDRWSADSRPACDVPELDELKRVPHLDSAGRPRRRFGVLKRAEAAGRGTPALKKGGAPPRFERSRPVCQDGSSRRRSEALPSPEKGKPRLPFGERRRPWISQQYLRRGFGSFAFGVGGFRNGAAGPRVEELKRTNRSARREGGFPPLGRAWMRKLVPVRDAEGS